MPTFSKNTLQLRVIRVIAVPVLVSLVLVSLVLGVALRLLEPPELDVPPQQDIIFSNVTIVNPGQQLLKNQSIVINAGRIKDIRAFRPDDPKPLCDNCFAMPGLIDAHVHTPPAVVIGNQALFALLYLAHGVTSVRDVGQSEEGVAQFAQQLNDGVVPGPHMYRCGPVLDGNPPGWPVASKIENEIDGKRKVEELANAGVNCIKVYNELDKESFHAIAKAAKNANVPLIGHVPHKVKLVDVTDFEVQHMTGVPYVSRPRPPVGWDIRNEDILAMTEQDINVSLAIAKSNNISFTPTLANFRLRLSASDPSRFQPPSAEHFMPKFWKKGWDFVAGHPETEQDIQLQLRGIVALQNLVMQSHIRGIDILAGTDTLMPWVIPGASLLQELQELSVAMNSTEQALIAATLTNAKHLDVSNIGQLQVGFRADMIISKNNPLHDLQQIEQWHSIVSNGRVYSKTWMQDALKRYQQHFNSDYYTIIMDNLIELIAKFYGSTSV